MRELYEAAKRFVDELERIARIEDDAQRGLAFKRFLRSSTPVLPVPSPRSRKHK